MSSNKIAPIKHAFVAPFRLGKDTIQGNSKLVVFYKGRNITLFQKRWAELSIGLSLLIPLVNAIIYLTLKRFGKDTINSITDSKNSQAKKKPKTPSSPFDRIENPLMIRIFKYLDLKDLGKVSQISKRFQTNAKDPEIWKEWAKRHGYPIKGQAHPRDQVKKLHQHLYFLTEKDGKPFTVIKRHKGKSLEQSVMEALNVYPNPAYTFCPGPNDRPPHHLYYRDTENKVHHLMINHPNNICSEEMIKYTEIINNNFYNQLIVVNNS